MSINWASIYATPIGSILSDFTPESFTQLLVEGSQRQLTALQNTVTQDSALIQAWTTLQSDAQVVNGDITSLSLPSTFQQLTATSSNPRILTASDSSAQPGTYSLTVDQLAQAEIDQGQPPTAITSDNTALGFSGTFQIYTGSTAPSTDIAVTSTDTLQQIADAITAANTGVTASTEQLANGDWTIAIQGNTTGSANSIHYVAVSPASGTSSPLYQLGLWNTSLSTPTYFSGEQLQVAQNAAVNFGATASTANALSSSTNTFTSLVPGLTITVASVGSATITVGPNVTAMQQSVQQFATDWNQWVTDTQKLADAGTVTSTGTGTGSTYQYQSNANQVISSTQPQTVINTIQTLMGQTLGTGTYQSLADIGLTFQGNGQIAINSSALTNALSSDPAGVGALFQQLNTLLNPGNGTLGPLQGFYSGGHSVTGEAVAYETAQKSQTQSQITLLQNQLNAQEQQAIIQYGQWVNQVAQYSQEDSLITTLFNQNSGNNSTSSGG
ncbi:MAG: flagellar hook protein FliD [Sulfobacillus benefaciens]|uniref:Flagellar hook-associated protein 2 n=1 Tax=Sulfobacillus benefaciens TaxID=453960 RepID=A0A2T2XIP5_9FIRM|nr:MAG: flagellar hook protein FliD [Sulfobacillus benefaciens]